MNRTSLVTTFVLLAGIAVLAISGVRPGSSTNASGVDSPTAANGKPKKTMRAFSSEKELREHFAKLAREQMRVMKMSGAESNTATADSSGVTASPTVSALSESKSAGKDDESVTNTQHAGVDEGGIVKLHGDHLVILRRGRLFTVRVGDNSLRPVDAINAYAPGVDPRNDWYDEMLISDNTVVVIGYSYGRGGTEINLFDIDARGGLDYRSTYHMRSNDYYSSRNYASRLIGNKLIFYTPQYLGYGNAMDRFPAVRKWRKGATNDEFENIVQPTRVYRVETSDDRSNSTALHTVTTCDLAARQFSCQGTAIVGSPGRVFYVSPTSVYVWTTEWNHDNGGRRSASMLYRMPLDASAPSALGVTGGPVDQFSFLESDDEHLNVLVRSDGGGEQMWGSEFAAGETALFRVSISEFSDGNESAAEENYRELPTPEGYTFQNRFVGNYLLYGTGSGWGRPINKDSAGLFAVNWKNGQTSELMLKHGVDRIEQMGSDAVVVGTNGSDLYFSPIRLGDIPTVRAAYTRKNASQGELRSHGFFYKPDGKDSGLLGLPIARQGRSGYRHLVEGSAAILFLRNDSLSFDELGELGAENSNANDNCKASCVDWYGNARPLFVRGRVFALLGYELVEGSIRGNRIEEQRRINYSPRFVARYSEE